MKATGDQEFAGNPGTGFVSAALHDAKPAVGKELTTPPEMSRYMGYGAYVEPCRETSRSK